MGRFDRYMLSQFIMLFGFFALILVSVYWINRAVALIDRLISNGQSALTVLEFTLLSLPTVISLVLPVAAFVASVFVTNRLIGESQITAAQAAGMSAARLARPAAMFGGLVMVMMLALTSYLVPLSTARLAEREAEITRNSTARLLTAGEFIDSAEGITFYVREISAAGTLNDVFLSIARNADEDIIYTAAKAYIVRGDNGPQLVMVNGMTQTIQKDGQRLDVTAFDDFAYDIGALLPTPAPKPRTIRTLNTADLFFASDAPVQEIGESRAALFAAGHDRISQSIMGLMAAVLGLAALLDGPFSRFGVWRQIVVAIGLIIAAQFVQAAAADAIGRNAALWYLSYADCLFGAIAVTILLRRADADRRPKRREAAA